MPIGRSAFRAADRRRRHCARRALCAERLDRPVPGAARHQGRLHAARHLDRADLIGLPFVVRTVQPVHRRDRPRGRGGRRDARRQRFRTDLAGHPAGPCAGDPDRLRARLRARRRRVRLGDLHRRQYSLRLRDRAAADRDPAGGVRLCRRDRDRRDHADDLLRHAVRHQSRSRPGAAGGMAMAHD